MYRSIPAGSQVFFQGDLTADGLGDLIIVAEDRTRLSIFAGPLSSPEPAATVVFPQAIHSLRPTPFWGDLNGDGNNDLILSSVHAGELRVFYGPLQGQRDYQSPDFSLQGNFGSFMGTSGWIGDLDGDGFTDLVVGAPGEPEEACVIAPNGTLVFRGPISGGERTADQADTVIFDNRVVEDCRGWFLHVADFNGDRQLDLLVGTRRGRPVAYWGPLPDGALADDDVDVTFGDSEHTFTRQSALLRGAMGSELIMLRVEPPEPPQIIRLVRPFVDVVGGDAIAQTWQIDVEGLLEPELVVADLDNDGFEELIVSDPRGSQIGAWIFTGPLDESGTTLSEADHTIAPQDSIALGDVDGDGAPELAIHREGAIQILKISRAGD